MLRQESGVRLLFVRFYWKVVRLPEILNVRREVFCPHAPTLTPPFRLVPHVIPRGRDFRLLRMGVHQALEVKARLKPCSYSHLEVALYNFLVHEGWLFGCLESTIC
jgi:hypothetical protein